MAASRDIKDKSQSKLDPVSSEWGQSPQDHFGYASDDERLAKRGLEDWELVNTIPESQRKIPVWFIAVVVVVLLIAIGLIPLTHWRSFAPRPKPSAADRAREGRYATITASHTA